tara:strand:+ start:72 stop:2078 length:2007 start_codon:yes stop_codon:yes gene_type:complete
LNNFQIQKLIFICLAFPYILIFSGDVNPSTLEKNSIITKKNRFSENNILLYSKFYKRNQLLADSSDIKNNYSDSSQKKFNDKNIKTLVNELIIESKVQSEKDNILYADGDVVVKFKDNILKADSLYYNKKSKFAKAEGNIQLKIKNQIFEADIVEYDFVKRKGNFKNIKGLINSESIISDFDFYSNSNYENLLSTIQRIKKDKIIFTSDKVSNWIFSAELLNVDQNKWSSKQAFLTNDLLETNQIKLQFNELKVYSDKEKLRFQSKINNLIFQDKIIIPFWVGDRKIFKKSENPFVFQNRWNIGYDKLNKDGLFIGRKLNSIKIKNDLFLNVEPQFLFQRTLTGKTKSFVQRNYSLNSPRVERNISLSDYFALRSAIEGKIQNWDLKIIKELNSFDLDKFSNSLRTRGELSQEINLFNTKFVSRIFGAYRERIWNGSIGESEIYNAYGWQLDQKKSWENGSLQNNQLIIFALGNYKAEELNSSDFAESYKGSVTYQLKQRIPIYQKKIDSEYIDKSFEYIPEPIKQGVFINSKISANYNSYKDGNSQKYFGVGLGPEFVKGNFKKDFFDYTRLSIMPFYKFNSGKSIFKFDQVSEDFIINLNFDQHLIGPWLIETQGTLNLDQDSDDYGEFIYSRIAMNFKKRSYSFGIFYQPYDQAGGINFTLNGFK